jgi:hypothetical protein
VAEKHLCFNPTKVGQAGIGPDAGPIRIRRRPGKVLRSEQVIAASRHPPLAAKL